MENSNKEARAIASWQYMDDLKAAFEAGESFNNECHCGECSYCIDVKDEDAPNFEDWYFKKWGHFRAPHPIETPAIATSEGVEGAAERLFPFHPQDDEQDVERCKDRRNGFEVGAEYMKQHILTTHVPVDEVEKIISQYPGLFRNTSCRLSLLEEIKSLKSKTVL